MCFSAQASFTTSALLSIIGLISLKSARNKSERILALVPLFFALQQGTEGVLWLELTKDSATLLSQLAMYLFLFFTLIFWPIWIPLTLSLIERNPYRKKILVGLLGIGVMTAALFIWFIPTASVSAELLCNHIYYNLHLPHSTLLYNGLAVLYLSSTVLPLLISTVTYLWIMGIAVAIAYAITYMFYRLFLISVWCFFAALISSFILYIILHNPHKKGAQ